MTPVAPKTTGNVFQISRSNFIAGVVPTNALSPDHPFTAFWADFQTKIVTPTDCRPLLEAYVVNIIRDHPPDVLILDQPAHAGYGLHLPDRWPYICVSKFWVDQWTLAMAFDPKRRLALALESVLRGTLVHEVAHWFFSLYSNKPLDTSNLQDLSSLSPQAIQDGKEKSLRAEWSQWTVNGGEAGNFVERIAGGGIIGFHLGRDDVLIQTDIHQFWSPSTAFLSTLRQKGYALFVPSHLGMPMYHSPSTQLTPPRSRMLAFNHYDAMGPWGVVQSNFVGDLFPKKCGKISPPSAIKKYLEREGMPIWLGFPNC